MNFHFAQYLGAAYFLSELGLLMFRRAGEAQAHATDAGSSRLLWWGIGVSVGIAWCRLSGSHPTNSRRQSSVVCFASIRMSLWDFRADIRGPDKRWSLTLYGQNVTNILYVQNVNTVHGVIFGSWVRRDVHLCPHWPISGRFTGLATRPP
jgi:hypothetical protein